MMRTCSNQAFFFLLLAYRNHYVEYLCSLIRHNNLETIPILTADDLETCVRRANKKMPPRPYGILEGIYRQYLLEVQLHFLMRIFVILDSFFLIKSTNFNTCFDSINRKEHTSFYDVQ